MVTVSRVEELVLRRWELQGEIRDIDSQLEHMLTEFKGSLVEAIAAGLVKPAFPTSRGFKGFVHEVAHKIKD